MFRTTQCGLIHFYLEFNILSIYDGKNKDDLGNFEIPRHTQKIDTPTTLKTI